MYNVNIAIECSFQSAFVIMLREPSPDPERSLDCLVQLELPSTCWHLKLLSLLHLGIISMESLAFTKVIKCTSYLVFYTHNHCLPSSVFIKLNTTSSPTDTCSTPFS